VLLHSSDCSALSSSLLLIACDKWQETGLSMTGNIAKLSPLKLHKKWNKIHKHINGLTEDLIIRLREHTIYNVTKMITKIKRA